MCYIKDGVSCKMVTAPFFIKKNVAMLEWRHFNTDWHNYKSGSCCKCCEHLNNERFKGVGRGKEYYIMRCHLENVPVGYEDYVLHLVMDYAFINVVVYGFYKMIQVLL